jgi:hypothetical protein
MSFGHLTCHLSRLLLSVRLLVVCLMFGHSAANWLIFVGDNDNVFYQFPPWFCLFPDHFNKCTWQVQIRQALYQGLRQPTQQGISHNLGVWGGKQNFYLECSGEKAACMDICYQFDLLLSTSWAGAKVVMQAVVPAFGTTWKCAPTWLWVMMELLRKYDDSHPTAE